MTNTIEELLHRRTDLSTFLVHFTKDCKEDGTEAEQNLLSILGQGRLLAKNPFGMATRRGPDNGVSQSCVCFSEAPLEHVWMLCSQIQNRQIQLKPYGLVITRALARRRGCNPVWYLDQTDQGSTLTAPVVRMLAAAERNSHLNELLLLTPFLEEMGPHSSPSGDTRKDFWWEREWRHVGNFEFAASDLVAVLAPENRHDVLAARLGDYDGRAANLLDPKWSLQRMIAELAGVKAADAQALTPPPNGRL